LFKRSKSPGKSLSSTKCPATPPSLLIRLHLGNDTRRHILSWSSSPKRFESLEACCV
jgi:hypothetical protein